MKSEIIRLDWVSKSFDGIPVVKYVNFNLYNDEIHAVVGANGVGKSTVLRLMSGRLSPDRGNIYYNDILTNTYDAANAKACGIYTVDNDPEIVSQFDLVGNVGMQLTAANKSFLYAETSLKAYTAKLIERLELTDVLRLNQSGYSLSVLQKQAMHIMCAFAGGAKAIIMDEPFATLDGIEILHLKKLMRKVKAFGIAIVFVSHNISDVFELADRVTILRDGCTAATFDNPRNLHELNKLMTYHMIGSSTGNSHKNDLNRVIPDKEMFRVEDCYIEKLDSMLNFNVRVGEILGIVSFGAARTSICEKIFHLEAGCSGKFFLEGKQIHIRKAKDALKSGIGFMCDDNNYQRIFPDLSIEQNMSMPFLDRLFPARIPSRRIEHHLVRDFGEFLMMDKNSNDVSARHLSMGMQKRLALSRWFCMPLKLVMLAEAAKGLDTDGRTRLDELILKRASEGTSFIVEASNYDNIVALCDRVILINDNKVLGVLNKEDINQQTIIATIISNSRIGGDFIV